MQLSPDQRLALETIFSWLRTPHRTPNQLTLGGYAGTGKTTITAVLRKLLHKRNPKLKVAFVSFTGKAARVLKTTLQQQQAVYEQDFVGTIHSLIYAPMTNQHGEIISWDKKRELDTQLIVVDEASMVNQSIWYDLISFGLPILAIGDHGQLPPIEGQFNLMDKPDIKLEKIHRQASDNPIIKISIMAREEGKIPVGKYGSQIEKIDQQAIDAQEKVETLLRQFNPETMILAGYNHTRVRINDFIRQQKFFEATPEPLVGDRIICLKNNHQKKIYNGMLGTLTHLEIVDDDFFYAEIDLDENDQLFQGQIYRHQFGATHLQSFTPKQSELLKNADLFDFGYGLTVHKAQGSQAKRVILFEERFKQMSDEDWRRWLYTGVTRAEEELFIIGSAEEIGSASES